MEVSDVAQRVRDALSKWCGSTVWYHLEVSDIGAALRN